MARDVVDIAFLEADLASGNVELEEAMSFEVNETDPGAEAVKTMRRARRSIGFKQGVPEYEATLEVKPVNPPEVDWLSLRQSQEIFQIFYQESDEGDTFHVVDCLVTEVAKSFNADGEATLNVTILALNHVPLPIAA